MTVTDHYFGEVVIEITATKESITDPAQVKRYRKFRTELDKYEDGDNLRAYLDMVEEYRGKGIKLDRADVLAEVIGSLIGWEEFWAWVAWSDTPPFGGNAMDEAVTTFIEDGAE